MKKDLVEDQIEKVQKLDRSVLLREQNKSKNASCFPSSVIYNRALPKTKNIYFSNTGTRSNRANIIGHISSNPDITLS